LPICDHNLLQESSFKNRKILFNKYFPRHNINLILLYFKKNNVYHLLCHREKTGIANKVMGEELQYIVSFDSDGNPLEGGKTYKFHLPPNIPARNFWSVIVYDNQTRLIIHTDQKWPSVYSNYKSLVVNQDGSVDTCFGPEAPVGKDYNWIQTIQGKGWIMILRLYDPLEQWFNKSWRPGEIEVVI
jgi:hypothetical protein